MGHTLLNILQKVFAGKTSARAKILMILCSNIFISPIQQSVYSQYCFPLLLLAFGMPPSTLTEQPADLAFVTPPALQSAPWLSLTVLIHSLLFTRHGR